MTSSNALRKKFSENIVGKGENAGAQQFLPFSTMFSTVRKTRLMFWIAFNVSSANAFKLDKA